MFLGNDEELRSKEWKAATLISTILIIVIAIYFLTKIFTINPLKGEWEDEDGSLNLIINSNGKMSVQFMGLAEDQDVDVEMEYTMDKDAKTISISTDGELIREIAAESDGAYTQEMLENAISRVDTTFNYNVEQGQLTLTEREYGEQIIFLEK